MNITNKHTYNSIGRELFGKWMGHLVKVIFIVNAFGVSSIYLNVISANISFLLQDTDIG